MEKKLVGKIVHYYGKISVAVVDLVDDLAVGDKISIEGPTTGALEQTVESMQIEHKNVGRAGKGASIGLKVDSKVHKNDAVYKVVE